MSKGIKKTKSRHNFRKREIEMKAAVESPEKKKLKQCATSTEEAIVENEETRVVWECLVGDVNCSDQYWAPYDADVSSQIEEAYQRKVNTFSFQRGGVKYTADFVRLRQCRYGNYF
jgi:hypothetical protein